MFKLSRNAPTAGWVGEFEWPEEVGGLFEVRADRVDFMDEIFNADDAVLAQGIFNDLVVRQGDSLLVDLAVASLVDEFTDGGQVRVPVGHVWLNDSEELRRGLGDSNKDAVVDLMESQQLERLSWLWSNLVNTLDADNKRQLWQSLNIELAVLLRSTLSLNDTSLARRVFRLVFLSALKDNLSLGSPFLVSLLASLNNGELRQKRNCVCSAPKDG